MLIHLEKLGKSFGEKVVLHDVSASVEKEDRIGIVGQNGAGKTTLLKILTGVYTDYDGEFSVTHGVTLGYLEQNAKLDVTLDIYGEMRSSFAPVLDAMAQMQILEKKMAASPDDAALLEKHDELQNIIDAADGYNMDVNIKKVLSGMGFAQDTWSKNVGVLSGGELTRLRLAKLLLEKPDVLILDEPTNHLDFATMEWLENYLKGYSGAVLVVSHDRYFLDNVCTRIWEVSFQTMTTYKGNFSAYLPQKEAADALRQKQHDADVALAEKLQDYIDRNLVRASTTKMAQSRRRQLEKLEITEAPQDETNQLKFRFEYDVEPWNELVLLKNLTIQIGDRTLLEPFTYTVCRGQRLIIAGPNGAGKSPDAGAGRQAPPLRRHGAPWHRRTAQHLRPAAEPHRRGPRHRRHLEQVPPDDRAGSPQPSGKAGLPGRDGLQALRGPVRRRAGPTALCRDRAGTPEPAVPGRAYQPSGHLHPREPDRGADGLHWHAAPRHP